MPHIEKRALIARLPCDKLLDGKEKGGRNEQFHVRDNIVLFRLFDYATSDPFPATTLWEDSFVAWSSNMGKVVETEFRESLGDSEFEKLKGKACSEFDSAGDLNKTSLYIGTLMASSREAGARSESLDKLYSWILWFGQIRQFAAKGKS